jgi:CubicO group peptidase (beta-lactamase class C family)
MLNLVRIARRPDCPPPGPSSGTNGTRPIRQVPLQGPCRCLAAFALFLAIPWTISAQDLATRADEYLIEQTRTAGFSGAVLIAREGKVLFSKGYGLANVEHDVTNTPQTKFRLGSVTKQFTALAIMILQERGKLNVQDHVSKFVPDSPEAWRDITLHHLLTHTAGIPNLTTFPDHRTTMMLPSPTASTVARFKDKALEFKPGERFNYSNSGYVLLGYVIERISGESYEAFLLKNIFEPLQMTDSGYDHNEMVLTHRAAGYVRPRGTLLNAPYQDMSVPHGAGALYSTVEDLLKWDQGLYSEKLVSKMSLDAMFTPFKGNYAYGWIAGQTSGRRCLEHAGSINGFTSFIARFPEDRTCVVVLSNHQWIMPRPICLNLAALAFGGNIDTSPPRKGKKK